MLKMKKIVCNRSITLLLSVVTLILCPTIAEAANMTLNLTIDGIYPSELAQGEARGKGYVYVDASSSFAGSSHAISSDGLLLESTKVMPKLSDTQYMSQDNRTITFSGVSLRAIEADGSRFIGWGINGDIEGNTMLVDNDISSTNKTYTCTSSTGGTSNKTHSATYYAKFIARTYQARVENGSAIILNADGSTKPGGGVVTYIIKDKGTDGTTLNDASTRSAITMSDGVSTFTQSADNQGGSKGASYEVEWTVTVEEGYYLAGWATNPDGTGLINGATTKTYTDQTKTETETSATTRKLYAVLRECVVYKDNARAVAILVNNEGVPEIKNGTYVKEGGYVNINAEAVDQMDVTAGTGNYITSEATSYKFNYTYNVTEKTGYKFMGWYDKTALENQCTTNGKVDFSQAESTQKSYEKEHTTTVLYSNKANAPEGATMYAVFRPSITYWHYGPHVTIGGDAEDRADKGKVYADNGEAGSVEGVAAEKWAVELYDKTPSSQVDNPVYTYTYYAKTDKPEKYAFKGWAYTPYEEPTYKENPLKGCEFTTPGDNTTEDNPYLTPTLYAIFESYFYKAPPASFANLSENLGSIAVSLEATNAPTWSDVNLNAADVLQQVAADEDQYEYSVHYYAKKKLGSYFLGWSTTADGLNIIPESNTEENGVYHYVPKNNYITRAKDKDFPHVAAPLYAVFRSDIDIRQQDRMIVYIDDEGNGNINDAKVLVDFQKADILTATLSGNDASFFTLSNRSGSKSGKTINFDATQGLIEMVVSYTNDDLRAAVGKKAEITFSANYEGQTVTRSIVIVVEEAPIITFLPTDGKGTYTVKMTNGSGVNYTMDKTATENLKVAVTHESMSNIEMHLTEDVKENPDNYYFFGWQMIDGDEVTYLSYDELCNYQFTKSVKVRAQFLHPNHATYFIKGDLTNTPYSDLALALADASKLKHSTDNPQVVVFNAKPKGVKIKEGILPQGDYTIPEGVTLLIPGDDTNRHVETLEEKDYEGAGFTEYVKWTVEKGTTITVKGGGAVSIYANILCEGTSGANGRPAQYGHIQLGENVKMTFESGANLYAFGYITGSQTASVLMKDGSKVKEMFQIYDWRGGSATGLRLNTFKDNKVFIVGQYYVQNIEVPLTLEPNAKEILAAGLPVSGGITHTETTFMSADAGFFQMGDATTITKYYNADEDRLVFVASQMKTPTKIAKLGGVSLTVRILIAATTINSAEFVLPVPHNYDVIMKDNVTVQVLHDFALMPGATMTIDKGATCKLQANSGKANLYVYDKKYSTINGVGYFGQYNKEFIGISNRPGGRQYERASNDIVDAKIVVDGVLECTSTGALYTTNSYTESVDHANITSNGGGKVIYNTLGSTTKIYQVNQSGTSVSTVNLPVAPARLLNAKGNILYQVPDDNETYTYRDGIWRNENIDGISPNIPAVKNNIPTFTVSPSYTFSTYVGESQGTPTDIVTANDNVDWTSTSVTWAYSIVGQDADQFSFTWGGTQPSATVTFTPESEGVKKAVLRITATYEKAYDYNASKKHKHIYTKDVQLIGNASYLKTNTLAFEDLNVLYTGQGAISLFKANSKNNSKPITISITPNPNVEVKEQGDASFTGNTEAATITPTKVGSIVITATQDADLTNHIAATTISKTVEVTERVVWNWDILYFGTVNENPITVLDGSTNWTLTEKEDKSNIIAYNATNKTATIEDQIAGKYEVTFTFTQNGESQDFKSTVIANPQHLRVDVNNDTVFRAVTLSANETVEFNTTAKAVKFQSTANSISQWKMTFIGVPDKIYFKPQGNNAWQIEESYNGINWTTSFPWKYIANNSDFEMSLMPSTRYLRISYGAGETTPALLKELYITELAHVKADVEKLYMPFTVNEDGTKAAILTPKEIVLTYANTATLSIATSNKDIFKVKKSSDSGEAGETLTIPPTTETNPFGITGIEVISHATTEQQGYLYVYEGSNMVLQIPITTYAFPQELPIKLATDKPDGGDRYYYVATRTHNAEWNGTDGVRTITLNNAVSDAAPEVVFAFRGNPTYISFDHTTAKGTWEIEQSTDGANWEGVPHNDANSDIMNGTQLKRTVSPTANYLRVIYQSPYAEKINITNLVIVGDASAVVDPALLELYDDTPKSFTASVVNLAGMTITVTKGDFAVSASEAGTYTTPLTLTRSENGFLDGKQMGDIPIFVKWNNTSNVAIEYGMLEITNPNKNNELMATVELIGIKDNITSGDMGIYTGVHNGKDGVVVENAAKYTLNGSFEDEAKEYRKVNINAAIAPAGTPLFDYVVIYGETTTNDGTTTITTPTTMVGSNAKTPIYIYKKNDAGTAYTFFKRVENANSKEKAWNVGGDDADAVTIPANQNSVSMYITGFCPYASTGYTKADEGVWYFRAKGGQFIHIYLEDCFIYSRSKTDDGHAFIDRGDGYSFIEPYVCGSGAVLVFACDDKTNAGNPMNVTIHTLDRNMLKSHYGCFLQSVAGRAYQASSPMQIRVIDNTYIKASATTLNFTDEWPASQNAITGKRTNGFLSLQKQVNNAPSIDMGNGNTIVNFNGGQVELQNAQIVSPNYKSSLAICPRAGTFAGILLAYGMGTDDVEGTVNFNDGTTTVLPMYVSPDYAESYLLDKDASGNPIKKDGKFLTTCLRTPAKTFVYGGSHCMMRACTDPESQGGAPKDKDGNLLGLYKYPQNPASGHRGGWSVSAIGNGLVTPTTGNVPDYYKVESVTPNPGEDGQIDEIPCSTGCDDYLNFWFDPNFESAAQPEINKQISFWKTCMTLIKAEYAGYGGSVGGNTSVAMSGDLQTEIVKYLLYCKIDDNILEIISEADYQAPVMNPAPEGGNYLPVHPSEVGEEVEHYITNEKPFQVENKLYYITTATADVWNAFTAPFDVANIYIMETYPENELQKMEDNGKTRSEILKEQAKHNADFASFFGVTIALKQNKTFDRIYSEYMSWANTQDATLGLKTPDYTPRGMQKLVPFNGSNWSTADFYLNENNGDWVYTGTVGKEFETQWIFPDASDGVLLEKGKTYSMLLPFCTKCADNGKNTIEDRTFWDYWSGKFLIFESTDGPHEVQGKNYVDDMMLNAAPANNSAILMGNSSFAEVEPAPEKVYYYSGDLMHSTFSYDQFGVTVNPTESFVMMNVATPSGVRVKGLTTSGQLIYDNDGTATGGNIPTVGGGNDLFITDIVGGVNIAVAEPQQVRVMSATGAIIYSGMVQTAVDVFLPTAGVYVVAGDNEVHKILH